MIEQLMSFFPPTDNYETYVDAYGGAGTVLLNKPRTGAEIYNDLEKNVYSLFKTLSDRQLFEEFERLAQLALYDEATSDEFVDSIKYDELGVVERAFRFWYVARTRFSGNGGFSINAKNIRRGMSKSTSDFLSSVEALPELHARLKTVVVTNRDALDVIRDNDFPRTFIYLDPPYVLASRTSTTRYRQDATDDHHRQLVSVLNDIKHAYIVLSGYENEIYDVLDLKKFTKHSFDVNTQTGNFGSKVKTECVWRNFEPVKLLL